MVTLQPSEAESGDSQRVAVPVFRRRFATARPAKNGDPPPPESCGVASWHQRSDPPQAERGDVPVTAFRNRNPDAVSVPHLAEVLRTMKHATVVVLMLAAIVLPGVAFATVPPDKPRKTKPKAELGFKNPVRKISAMMKKAGKLLDQLETGDPTQDEQKKILEELDKLIEMAEKSSSSQQQQQQQQRERNKTRNTRQQPQNSGNTGGSPMQSERDVFRAVRPRLGAGAPDARQMWGKLPEATRDEILQLLNEKLPLKYQQLLKLYFKALSEKK